MRIIDGIAFVEFIYKFILSDNFYVFGGQAVAAATHQAVENFKRVWSSLTFLANLNFENYFQFENNLIQGWHLHMYKSLFIKCYEKSILLTNILKINCKDFKYTFLNFYKFMVGDDQGVWFIIKTAPKDSAKSN